MKSSVSTSIMVYRQSSSSWLLPAVLLSPMAEGKCNEALASSLNHFSWCPGTVKEAVFCVAWYVFHHLKELRPYLFIIEAVNIFRMGAWNYYHEQFVRKGCGPMLRAQLPLTPCIEQISTCERPLNLWQYQKIPKVKPKTYNNKKFKQEEEEE